MVIMRAALGHSIPPRFFGLWAAGVRKRRLSELRPDQEGKAPEDLMTRGACDPANL
jgi:hypothetical protein